MEPDRVRFVLSCLTGPTSPLRGSPVLACVATGHARHAGGPPSWAQPTVCVSALPLTATAGHPSYRCHECLQNMRTHTSSVGAWRRGCAWKWGAALWPRAPPDLLATIPQAPLETVFSYPKVFAICLHHVYNRCLINACCTYEGMNKQHWQ